MQRGTLLGGRRVLWHEEAPLARFPLAWLAAFLLSAALAATAAAVWLAGPERPAYVLVGLAPLPLVALAVASGLGAGVRMLLLPEGLHVDFAWRGRREAPPALHPSLASRDMDDVHVVPARLRHRLLARFPVRRDGRSPRARRHAVVLGTGRRDLVLGSSDVRGLASALDQARGRQRPAAERRDW